MGVAMTDPIPLPPDRSDPAPLALRPKQAAKALGIGERLLWSMTNSGQIPHVRLGRAIVYPVDELRRWLAEQAKGGEQ
jgi:excisionase family DNA binding protein